jgi:hypothetical protein
MGQFLDRRHMPSDLSEYDKRLSEVLFDSPSVRERIKTFYGSFSRFLGLFQPGTARLPAVIPLYRFRRIEGFRGSQRPPFFHWDNSENSGAAR